MKHKTPKTIRFETYCFDGWVTLELRDGQTIEFTEGGPTEEGYSYERHCYSREGEAIYSQSDCIASDCDGRLDHYSEHVAYPLRDGYVVVDSSRWRDDGKIETTKALDWKELSRSQRDYSAEAMGY